MTEVSDSGDTARDASRDRFVAVASSVPADDPATAWLVGFAREQADPVEFLARLYMAADRFASDQQEMLNAAKAAAHDFFAIVARHKTALTALAYETAPAEQKAAATDLLNAAGLSRYHAEAA